VPLRNSGLSLGLVDASTWVETVAMAVGILIAAAVLLPRARGRGVATATGLLLGGGTSNLLDRGLLGSVRDFWVLGPIVVNPADIAILAGFALLAWAQSRSPGR
jgi:lipoprotein signal peptidase